jgi:hypothetical protein
VEAGEVGAVRSRTRRTRQRPISPTRRK